MLARGTRQGKGPRKVEEPRKADKEFPIMPSACCIPSLCCIYMHKGTQVKGTRHELPLNSAGNARCPLLAGALQTAAGSRATRTSHTVRMLGGKCGV